MGVVGLIARTELRQRRLSLVTLAAITAIVTATVTLAVVGARRSAASVTRFESWSHAVDLAFGSNDPQQAAAIASFAESQPDVAAVTQRRWVNGFLDDGRITDLTILAPADATYGRTLERPRILSGRLPDPAEAGELLLNETAAGILGWTVGEQVRLTTFSVDDLDEMFAGGEPSEGPTGPELDMTIVGVGRFPTDLTGDIARITPYALASPALLAAHPTIGAWPPETHIRLRPGADATTFAERVYRTVPEAATSSVVFADDAYGSSARRAARTETVALLVVAIAAALAGTYVAGQAIARQLAAATVPAATLRQLGTTPRRSAVGRSVPSWLAGAAGAVTGLLSTIAAAPVVPRGLARRAAVDGARAGDVWVIAALVAAVAATVIAVITFLAARRPDGPRRGTRRSRSIEHAIRRLAAPPTVATGMRLAGGAGRSRSAARGAVVALAFATTVVVGTTVLDASLDRTESRPDRWGWNWTTSPETANLQDEDGLVEFLRDDPRIAAAVLLSSQTVIATDQAGSTVLAVDALAADVIDGRFDLVVADGRAPLSPTEVAVGVGTLDDLHTRVGDTITFTGAAGGEPVTFTVVGTAVLPRTAYTASPMVRYGAAFTADGLAAVAQDGSQEVDLALLYADDIDRGALEQDLIRFGLSFNVFSEPHVPSAIRAIEEALGAARLLAAFFSVAALLAVVHAGLSSGRSNRGMLGALCALGMLRRDERRAVAIAGLLLGLAGAAVGVPAGLALGRAAWLGMARPTGAVTPTFTPVGIVVIAGLLVVVMTVLVVPFGWRAATWRGWRRPHQTAGAVMADAGRGGLG